MTTEEKNADVDTAPRHGKSSSIRSSTSRLWRRLPAALKIGLIVPLVMAMLSAEVELRLAPQLDVILTVAAVWAAWAWLSGGLPPAT